MASARLEAGAPFVLRGTRGGWQDVALETSEPGVRILGELTLALWPLSSSTWRQAGAQVTQGSEDRKARGDTRCPSPPRKTDTGAGCLLVGRACCRKKLEEDGPGWEGAPRRLSHCLLTVYPRCAQTRTRQGPPPAPPDTPARSKTRTKAALLVEKTCQPGTKHGSMTGAAIIFTSITSTYSAPGTFSHALPPSCILPSSWLPVCRRRKLGACGSGIRVMEYPQL